MGVLNLTPDSFHPESRHDPASAVDAALRMADAGADWIDIGGESTRPGAEPVAEAEEIRRVVPAIHALRRRTPVPLSIDTRKPAVARAALDAGASILNDVGGFRDPEMARLAAASGARLVVMHMRGEPRSMQEDPRYGNVVAELSAFFGERVERLLALGVGRERIWLDPGIGFGKTLDHNLEILRRIGELRTLGFPLLVGTSRKSFLGALTGRTDPRERLAGTLASVCWLALQGVEAVRVHDVPETADALRVIEAVSFRP